MEGENVLIQWAVVVFYLTAMFFYASHESSSASQTNKLLAKWFPWLSNGEIREYVVILRKTGHVLAYGVLTGIVYAAARKTKWLRNFALPFAMAFSLVVAIIDESYQRRLAYRTGSWWDVAIDGIGIGLVGLGIWLWSRMKQKTNREVLENVEDECN